MPNALAKETSPYLLQHQDNPVEWVPWGEAAFELARAEDKLVFLSVGYSTCHWCHVMEHESFENEAIAAVMNEHFVCVKVDREERPDVDSTYMAFVQATTGQGGWPMSVWLTPEGKPVVGGTYFPPEDRHGRPGFPSVCRQLGKLWQDDRERMQESADKVMAHLQEQSKPEAVVRGLPDAKVFGDFIDRAESMFDAEWGGWGGAPKFPRPAVPRLLLQMADRFGKESDEGAACLQMVARTLRTMAAGGMHDQIGGGFHRYSVDRYWHVPHYEKMLYDQAQLALLYLEAWQIGGDERDQGVVEDIFRYVIRDMRQGSDGAFHAAEDADSLPEAGAKEKKEGAYWVWTADEISRLLEPKAAAVFSAAYGVEAAGNVRPESDPHGELEGTNTLYRALPDEALAETFEMSVGAVRSLLAEASEKLLTAREGRPKPHRDDKIVTAWNGLMIAALARGARVLGRPDLGKVAAEAMDFLKDELWDGGTLWRSWRGKRGAAEGFPADYTFVIAGLIELHALETGDRWLAWARELQEQMDRRFWDEERAGYVTRSMLGDELLMVLKDDYDGAEPAALNVAAENLLKLAELTAEERYAKRAEVILRAGARAMEANGFACPVLLGALDLRLRGVVKMDVRGAPETEVMKQLRTTYLPRAVFVTSEGPGEIVACEGETCRKWEPAIESPG